MWGKEESKMNKVSCWGACWCQLERQDTFRVTLCQRPHQYFQTSPVTATGPDLAHRLLTPVDILASCFIRVFIGCSVLVVKGKLAARLRWTVAAQSLWFSHRVIVRMSLSPLQTPTHLKARSEGETCPNFLGGDGFPSSLFMLCSELSFFTYSDLHWGLFSQIGF